MDEIRLDQRLRELFPRGSASFFSANRHGKNAYIDARLRSKEREPDQGTALVDQASGEEKSHVCPRVCVVMRRVRLLDQDNAYASAKCLIDCLCQVGLITDDSPSDIDLEVTQEKVKHFAEQRTEVRIIYG